MCEYPWVVVVLLLVDDPYTAGHHGYRSNTLRVYFQSKLEVEQQRVFTVLLQVFLLQTS